MRKIIFTILFFIDAISLHAQPYGWSEVTITPTPPKLNCIAINSRFWGGHEAWITGDSGTILYTSNAGTNWQYRNNSVIGNLNINVVSELKSGGWNLSGRALCAANSTATTYIYRTSNQGVNWSVVYQQPNGRIRSIVNIDTMICYAIGDPVGGRWTILKSTNNGISFDSAGLYLPQVGTEISNYNTLYYSIAGSNLFLFGTNNGRLYKSTNNCANWNSISVPFQNIYTVTLGHYDNGSPQGFPRGYAAGNGVVYTTNSGQNWTSVSLPGSGDIHTFYYGIVDWNIYNQYACYAKGSMIYATTNSTQPFTLAYTSPNGGNYTNIRMEVFTFEGGLRRGWAVKDNGTISRYYLTWAGVNKLGTEVPDNFTLSQNYPNPFNPTTTIEFDIPKKGTASLSLYDITGRLIEVLTNELMLPGRYSITWDGSNYASGVYFYCLAAKDFTQTKKLVLIK